MIISYVYWKIANKLCRLGDVVVFEDLAIKNMMARCKPKVCPETGRYLKNGQAAKKGLNRVIADAGWGELKLKTKSVAAKLGLIYTEVPARFSSQECNKCGHVSPINRKGEKFLCEECGYFVDADSGAANNLLKRGLKKLRISPTRLRGVPSKVTLQDSCNKETSLGNAGAFRLRASRSRCSPEHPNEPKNPRQLSIFDAPVATLRAEQSSAFEWRDGWVTSCPDSATIPLG